MAGHFFAVSGDPVRARDTVFFALQNQGFTVTRTDEWTARAERGSKGASIMLGAFAGKSGRHVILDIFISADAQGNYVITLQQGTSGWSGGVIGSNQADSIYSEIYNTVGQTFQQAGVLLTGGPL